MTNKPRASKAQACGVTELLVGTVCSWRMRAPSALDLQIFAIGILFGVNICCMHIYYEMCMILHKKNECAFEGTRFE